MIHALSKKIHDQREELRILNERCRTMALKLKVIHDLDYYKSQLSKISDNVSYRAVLTNETHARQLEAIFNRPFNELLEYYENLLKCRNRLVHKYTSYTWDIKDDVYKRKVCNKTLSELVRSEC